jgi:serine-type D-Ala-D-Ala carboxypeptidase
MHNKTLLFFLITGNLVSAQLTYNTPESVGLNSSYIEFNVDSIMNDAINQKAFPGAQLLVAKKGKIIFHKTYGFHTYDSVQKVAKDDIYDLASVTKIVGPLPALMKLYEEGKIDLDAPFSNYWTSWKS